MVNYEKRFEMLETTEDTVPGVKMEKIPICKRCHRKLKTPEAIERGMGKVCWEKSQTSPVKKPLFREDKDAKSNTRVQE
jgi:hypothetical protein